MSLKLLIWGSILIQCHNIKGDKSLLRDLHQYKLIQDLLPAFSPAKLEVKFPDVANLNIADATLLYPSSPPETPLSSLGEEIT